MSEHDLNIFEGGGLDERSKAYLLETTRWTKFLAILGFISIGFIIIAAFVMFAFGSAYSSSSGFGAMSGFTGIGLGLYYLIIGAVYLFPVFSLLKFSTNMKNGIQTNNMEQIAEGFRHQKNLFKFMGIAAIICIVLILLAFVFAGIFAAGLGR